jgi:hypothetical protein
MRALVRERDAALEEVRRLQAEVVRLHAKVQVLEDRERLAAAPVPRGLASLLGPVAERA